MKKYNIFSLRKNKGLSQKQLADLLGITQSFLSAIENGRSPLPADKVNKLHHIFSEKELNESALNADSPNEITQSENNPNSSSLDIFQGEGQMISQLINYLHRQSHQQLDHNHIKYEHADLIETDKINVLTKRIEKLEARNDRLSEHNDTLLCNNQQLRETIDSLRNQIFELKNIIVNNNLSHLLNR